MSWKRMGQAALIVVGTSMAADEEWERGRVSVSAFYAHLAEQSEHDNGSSNGPGVAVGLGLSERATLELSGSKLDDVDTLWLSGLLALPQNDRVRPYVVVGGGRAEFDAVAGSPEEDQLFAGIGAFIDVTPAFALRTDVRAVKTSSIGGVDPYAQVGLTWFLGGGAVEPAFVDSDGDGVADASDRCPETLPDRQVGSNGCEPDSDSDGVADVADQCPSTPRGASVDERGCRGDGDGDGVADGEDRCPDTAEGAVVDEVGCYVEIEEVVTIDMTLEFESDSAEILPTHAAEIDRVVAFMGRYPTTEAVIEGHTDSTGAAPYNQSLSERRAAAVRAYLIEEADIEPGRLQSVGYGESRPKADEDTEAGRRANRRVTARISAKTTRRQ